MRKIRGVKNNTNTEVVKRLYFFVLLTLFLILLFTYSTLSARADIATILPEMYSVSGEPLPNTEDSVQYTQYEYVWNNFQNDIVGGTTIQNVILRFSWSFLENDIVLTSQEGSISTIESDAPNTVDETSTSIENEPLDDFYTQETIPEGNSGVTPVDTSETTPEEESALENIDTTPEDTLPMEGDVQTNTDTSSELQVFHKSSGKFLFAIAQVDELIISTFIEPSNDIVTPSGETEPLGSDDEVVSGDEVITIDDVVSGDEVIIVDEVVSGEEVIIVDEVVSGEESTTPEVDNSIQQQVFDISVFQILFSLDGQSWELLGKEDFDTPGEVAYALPQISIESIHNLRIMVRYIQPTDDARKVYFDNVHIDIDVEPLLESPRVYSDNEPNFDISSVKADVESDTVRAVLLEKGGMLELWYSITNTKTREITWTKLLNDGSIDGDSPIAIKGKTIFWLDKNQQTLFGFTIDEQSIFGEPLNEPDGTYSSLTFEDENSRQWDATLDPDAESFEFSKSEQP